MKLCVALLAASLTSTAAIAAPAPDYRLVKSVALGAPDRWDYVVHDGSTHRVYVAHGDRLAVVDDRSGNVVGEVEGISGGTHGTAISLPTHQGFTDDGRNGKAVAFDLQTLKVTHEIPADQDADAVAIDRKSGHVFVVEGDPHALTVIDPRTDQPIATIKAGEKLEYAVGDDLGSIYVAGVGNGDVLKIDARTNSIVGRWPAPGCTAPHGIAVDAKAGRLFMGCTNKVMMVLDAGTGRLVATLPIGRGSDAVAFDPQRKRVFSSNGADGTISVYQEVSPDSYRPLATIVTAVSGRTMSVDPQSGRLFVAAAETEPNPTPGTRPKVKPGTLKLLIFAPRS